MVFITDPWFYLTAIPAVLIYGLGKGGLGGALGVVAVPLMALTVEPTQAAAIILPILCVMDVFAIRQHHKNVNWAVFKGMVPGSLLGILLASIFLSVTPEAGLKLFIGLICILFTLQYLLKRGDSDKKPGKLSAWFWSTLAGISSTAIHAGGGPASIYLLPLRMPKVALIGTMAVFFGMMNLVKLVPYTMLGGFDATNLMTTLLLVPFAPVGVYMGVWLLHRVSQDLIYRLCYFFLALSGLKLFYDGLSSYGLL